MARSKCKKCRTCAHVRVDEAFHDEETNWTAYECGNPESEFYRALLNVTEDGDMQKRITWTGCPQWREKV